MLCHQWTRIRSSRFQGKLVLSLPSLDLHLHYFSYLALDWDISLKPEVPHFYWSVPFPGRSNESADEPVDSPSKRKRAEDTSSSPERLQSTIPPPPSPLLPPRQVNSILKTPRPEITVGLRHATVVETITAQGVNSVDADIFLKFLQERQTLRSDPSQQSIPIRFPMLVVEGKSYSTGKFVFEAQNQAAVSGSCMLNMQHKLAQLAEPFAAAICEKREPLAFSVCTEGPHMELWVHYTTSTDGMRNYNMNILQTCHASLLEGVVEFLVVVDRVLSWARSEFVEDIAKQLASVERATRQHGT